MVAHRFAAQFRQPQTALVGTAAGNESFVACPVALFPAAQQAQIQEVYRLAAEQTRRQLKPKWSLAPAFSRN